ncbi:MAG: DUF2156 domain-containing protein [Blautia sp.]|nr:DUF2156 domain-containing protein [Blautia sp.]
MEKVGNAKVPAQWFAPVTIDQMEAVESIRLASGNTLYTYTFPTLFAWQADEQYRICLLDDAFLVKNGSRGENAYLFPCGTQEGKKKLIDRLLLEESPTFYFISDADKDFLEAAYPHRFLFTTCRDDYPYLYDKEAQISLKGKTYKRLRHHINLGRHAAQTWSMEALHADNIDRALAINQKWGLERSTDDLADTLAVETALRHFSRLGMWGLLFQADGIDTAFIAGSFVTPQIFDVNFCKVLKKQCDCYIKWALCQALPAEVTTLDSEEDMGLAGLRRHKMLRVPNRLTRVWKGSLQA